MLDALISLDPKFFIVIASAVAAAASFVAFSMPLLSRFEKREHYREVIEKKRRTLFEQAREQVAKNQAVKTPRISAAQSIASLYKLQSLAGDLSVQARAQMLQAGIRSTTAPLIYLASRVGLPLIFVGLGFLFVGFSQKPLSPTAIGAIILGLVVAGFYLPRILIKNMADKRQQEMALSFPDALDMILICVQGGIGIEASINRIGMTIAENSEVLAEEMGILSAELGMLNDRKAAYQGFAIRAGSGPAKSFAAAMLQAEQYGTSISKALRVLADESRDQRMAIAEQKAASLPPKLTVPMILFFLPPLFMVILGPAFIGMP
ncbi:MAG: type II secretion system F family protein [Alphaproteobacteria bacterium]|nr:type II secretion system F family protein [Alphaproteobacteria bacterium]